jgi:hypothetical protein
MQPRSCAETVVATNARIIPAAKIFIRFMTRLLKL